MKLEDIQSEWEHDAIIDKLNLDDASLEISSLHSKYLNILSRETIIFKAKKLEHAQLLHLKAEYYNGSLPPEELARLGWQLLPQRVLKEDIPRNIQADADVRVSNMNLIVCEEKLDFLKSVIQRIMWRGQDIRNSIDWIKFKNGVDR